MHNSFVIITYNDYLLIFQYSDLFSENIYWDRQYNCISACTVQCGLSGYLVWSKYAARLGKTAQSTLSFKAQPDPFVPGEVVLQEKK